MRKYHAVIALVSALFLSPLTFAQDATTPSTTAPAMTTGTSTTTTQPIDSCKTIANACSQAGFERKGGPGKRFWRDCMRPVLMGQSVTGVTIDPQDVTTCKKVKVSKMQKEIQDLQGSTP